MSVRDVVLVAGWTAQRPADATAHDLLQLGYSVSFSQVLLSCTAEQSADFLLDSTSDLAQCSLFSRRSRCFTRRTHRRTMAAGSTSPDPSSTATTLRPRCRSSLRPRPLRFYRAAQALMAAAREGKILGQARRTLVFCTCQAEAQTPCRCCGSSSRRGTDLESW